MINIVLYAPEIPQNTGNIMRTCMAIGARLHLIKPLGFSLDKQTLKRYAVNYIDGLDYIVYNSFAEFMNKNKGQMVFLTRYGNKNYSQVKYQETCYLIFGNESSGIPKDILQKYYNNCYRIPMRKDVRALNLSNTVAIVSYEAMRQLDFPELLSYDDYKGIDYLLK